MTREQAIEEAQRRNVADFRRTGDLVAVWTEFECRPGEWTVCLNEKAKRPLWQRAALEAADALVPGVFEDLPDRVWRRRFPR